MLRLLGVFSTKSRLLVFLQNEENMEENDWLSVLDRPQDDMDFEFQKVT